ncbi:MAG: TlyA family RNA methyltransferase [Pseudomonadota bacterium]
MVVAGYPQNGVDGDEVAGLRDAAIADLRVTGDDHPWVSRGGLKLQKALHHFGFDPTDRVAIDVGSSTGGFTDVLLTHGAERVYAVDVGRGQLAWKLRADPRVVVLEGRNARGLTAEDVPEPVGAIVCDASFIGLAKVLARPLDFAAPGAWLAALVKPQFEVGPAQVGSGGIVRDAQARADACAAAAAWLDDQPGWTALGVVESPIRGAKGNIEYLLGGMRD